MAKFFDMSEIGVDALNNLTKDLKEKTEALETEELRKAESQVGMVNEWLTQFVRLDSLLDSTFDTLSVGKSVKIYQHDFVPQEVRENSFLLFQRDFKRGKCFINLYNTPPRGRTYNADLRVKNVDFFSKLSDGFSYEKRDEIEKVKHALDFIAEKGDMVVDAVGEWAKERSRELMEERQKKFDKFEANANKFVEADFSKIKQKEETVSDRFLSLTRKYFEGGNNDMLLCASLALDSFNEQEKKEISAFLKDGKIFNSEGLKNFMDRMVSGSSKDVSVSNNKKKDDRKHDFPER